MKYSINLDFAIQRFKETHHNKNRNDDPILIERVKALTPEEFKIYVEDTEKWTNRGSL
jgi:hypothetical protein